MPGPARRGAGRNQRKKRNSMMQAKMQVHNVKRTESAGQVIQEEINMAPVCGKPFDKDGNSEDNSFARWTPCGSLNLTISNPNLFGKIKEGQRFYLNFVEAAD